MALEQLEEVRVTNTTTGGQKGSKIARYDLIPWAQMQEVAKLYGKGAEKYDDHNWRKGFNWSLSEASLMRHYTAFMEGESIDDGPEGTGCHHLASVVWHALTLMYFEQHYPELDDRAVTIAVPHSSEASA